MKHHPLRNTAIVLGAVFLSSQGHAGRAEFDFAVGLPSRKAAVDVLVRRNPFQAGGEPERPLPVVRDKDDPALKIPVLVARRLRSVIRGAHPLVLLDSAVLQPGDELHLSGEAVFERYRVVLHQIENDRLLLHLTSLDPQVPGQVDAWVPLGPSLRSN